ncbi:hypothetical protein Cenrod_1407 [Candidatus Symbiobacter mobilis CR]|uniref:Cobalamin adenosyltransferase n=2 Tax=Candidatus Symbiobacter TaxID=1436289 RepID=U5NBE4_9BURK|nr:hypothetical protein Cenrod_1407 [Candidatus Symbiobacter mobilis CR]
MYNTIADFPWVDELERTVVSSLATTFGLDFLLIEDKLGGDVDTIHNGRKNVWATKEAEEDYKQRGNYNSTQYHTHPNYIARGSRDKVSFQKGELHDGYRDKYFIASEQPNLDHIISAKEIHEDPGRVLAEMSGVELANKDSNLQSTSETINKSKKQTPIKEFLKKLPSRIEGNETKMDKMQVELDALPRKTPEQKHVARKLEAKIEKLKKKNAEFKSIDPNAMKKKDQEARASYNMEVNKVYYTSSKFIKNISSTSAKAGLRMGVRQVLGLVMAEVWYELRAQIPKILITIQKNFSFEKFFVQIKDAFHGIWHRVQQRFKDFLTSFQDGFFAGAMSNLTTTIFNIFATTQRAAIKIIREIWGQLIKAFKLIFFNPDQLSIVELCQAVAGILSAAAGVAIGSSVHASLLPLCNFPFGAELAGFTSALVTGLATLGLTYVLLHSSVAQKLWAYVESIMPHAVLVKKYQAINAELDRYLIELARLELNMNIEELAAFSRDLVDCNDEIQRGQVLNREIAKRGIKLPYEMGNLNSTRAWLASVAK